MIKELKEQYLIELNDTFNSLNSELDDTNKLLAETRKSAMEYLTKSNSSPSKVSEEYKEFESKYSKSYIFFHKKRVNAERIELCKKIKAQFVSLYQAENEKCDSFEKKIADIKAKIDMTKNKYKLVQNAKSIDQLGLTYEQAKDLLSKKNIDISSQNKIDILQLEPSEKTSGNIDFMKKAIEEHPFSIMYDKTNDVDLYLKLIDDTIKKYPKMDKSLLDSIKSLKNQIIKYRDDKSYIKTCQILELIRFYHKDVKDNIPMDMVDQNKTLSALVNSNIVLERALLLRKDDFEKINEEFESNRGQYDFYMHQAGKMGIEDVVFNKGLIISTQFSSDKKRHIYLNARKVESSLAIAGYTNFYGGSGGVSESRIIIRIPKNEEYPLGSDSTDGKSVYIRPEYIYGAIFHELDLEKGISSDDNMLHINNEERKVYKYLYRDHFEPGKSYHYKTNPAFEKENEF